MKNYRPLEELAAIYRAMHGEKSETYTLDDLTAYRPAETFEGFLNVNQLPVFEAVFRG